MMVLSSGQVSEFYKNGFLIMKGVFSKQEIGEMSYAISRLLFRARGQDEGEFIKNGSKFVVKNGLLERIVWAGAADKTLLHYGRYSKLTFMVAQLLEKDHANHLINQIHFKLPKGGLYPWHQDSGHRGHGTADWEDVDGKGSYVQTVTAIDEATMENGPLLFVPATKYEKRHLGLPYDKNKQTVSSQFDPADAIPALMQPGDVALFGPYTIHGSEVNGSDKPRKVFINGFAYPGANRRNYHLTPGDGAGELIKLV